jgi:hypothetical protein
MEDTVLVESGIANPNGTTNFESESSIGGEAGYLFSFAIFDMVHRSFRILLCAAQLSVSREWRIVSDQKL